MNNRRGLTRTMKTLGVTLVLALSLSACSGVGVVGSDSGDREQVTLNLATSTVESSAENLGLWEWVKLVEERADWIDFNYIGGPEAVSPTDAAESLQTGAFDVASVCTCYSTHVVPEAGALDLAPTSPAEDRENGALEIMQGFYADQGMHLLGGAYHGIGFVMHFGPGYEQLDIENLDLDGLLMRAPDSVRPALEVFDAEVVTLPISEVYTAMDRGTIDGFAAGNAGLYELGIAEPVAATLDVPVLLGRHPIMFNANYWATLDEETQEVLTQAMVDVEEELDTIYSEPIQAQREGWEADGKVMLEPSETAKQEIVEKAQAGVWEALIAHAPRTQELRDLYAKQ